MERLGITDWEIIGEQRNDKWIARIHGTINIELDDADDPATERCITAKVAPVVRGSRVPA